MTKTEENLEGAGGQSIEQVQTETLIPYARNSRTHSDEQVAQIMASIREFGFCNPVLIDAAGTIIAGHGRVMAATRMKLETVPCLRLSHLTEAQRRAYVIADNRIALSSSWDSELLANELSDLHADEFDMALLGFDADELAALLDFEQLPGDENAGEVVEDEVPEPPVDPITKPGDLWILGSHRMLCGDSTKAADVLRLMAGEKADLCFTSPPYGQQRDYTKESDCSDWDKLMEGVFANLPMSEAGQVLINLGLIHRDGEWIPYWEQWIEWMRSHSWRRFGWYVWDQMNGLPGNWNGRLAPSFEFVWHFNRVSVQPEKWIDCDPANVAIGNRATAKRAAGGNVTSMRAKDGTVKPVSRTDRNATKVPDSVIRISRCATIDMARENHPATFPIQLAAHFLRSWTGPVYEPFCGSGTTLIAAEQLNRKCYGMEISPAYCDVIVKRWENLTGKVATLETNQGE
jgi:DNA modification methylase